MNPSSESKIDAVPPSTSPDIPRDWRERVLSADHGRLEAVWRRLNGERGPRGKRRRGVKAPTPEDSQRFSRAVADSIAARELRRDGLPRPALSADLPILLESERIIEAIREHPVLVIAGETGSGKTTQLPQLCLAAGRGEAGLIGCTQPRRIAARSMASRVAEELGSELGSAVGYQVRFSERASPAGYIKFMTDGILLAEIQRDRWLSAYDTLIIDEAHERSLNIDFLLGYLKRLVRRRRDLRVIITSATIDTARFAAHFENAPIIEVEGRSYPVEIRYRDPLELAGEDERGLTGQVVAAMDAIQSEDPRGDVLVFLPGEREIRDAHQALSRRGYRHTEILPLYARLSARDQDRVFRAHTGRRVVLATNVAETSLTVPGIRYVIDPGVARVKRYSARRKLDSLQIEPVSQASANQRAGRCGRVGPGICYRLYAEADYASRTAFTDPEILRASLAGVILRMLDLGLGSIDDFPFVERPSDRAIADGWQQLTELGAIDGQRQLTAIGRRMAQLPVDVKLSRMLVAANEAGCLDEVLTIVAFLSIQDPRERPAEAREAADEAHASFADPHSDFASILKLWREYSEQHEALTQSKLRDWCSLHFLAFLRMREWRELHRQLKLIVEGFGWAHNAKPADHARLHGALLAGMPTQIGRLDESREYVGPRQRRFVLFPTSALAKKPPRWVLSAELLETRRLYGLTNARIEPEWVIEAAPQLIATRHFDPHWSQKQGRALVYEQKSLFGLNLIERRRVGYAVIDPADSHRLLVEALANDQVESRSVFIERNRACLEKALEEEARLRRPGLVADVDWRTGFYAGRIPHELNSVKALDAWYRRLDGTARSDLEWSVEDLMPAAGKDPTRFPTALQLGERNLRIRYRFDPGDPEDGATLELPLHLLAAIDQGTLEWAVPGLVEEAATELIRGLPKALRRNFVPAPDFARAFAESEPQRMQPLPTGRAAALAAFLCKRTGVGIDAGEFSGIELSPHLRVRIELFEGDGRSGPGQAHRVIDSARDLEILQQRHGHRAEQAFAQRATRDLVNVSAEAFPSQGVPRQVEGDAGVPAYPALVFRDGHLRIEAFAAEARADEAHRRGVRELLKRRLAGDLKRAARQLPLSPRAAMLATAMEGQQALRRELVDSAFDALVPLDAEHGNRDLALIREAVEFERLVPEISRRLFREATERAALAERILEAAAVLRPMLEPPLMGFAAASYADLRLQLDALVFPGFLLAHPMSWLSELPRYLEGMRLRVDRLQRDPARDEARLLELQPFMEAMAGCKSPERSRSGWIEFRWWLEEWRISLFAQDLGTREPVSAKRLAKRLEQLRAG